MSSTASILTLADFRTGHKLNDILRAVCAVKLVNLIELQSPRREQRLVKARWVYYWISRKTTQQSFPQIGRYCGNRDHSTVMHGIEQVEQDLARYQADIAAVMAYLERAKQREAA